VSIDGSFVGLLRKGGGDDEKGRRDAKVRGSLLESDSHEVKDVYTRPDEEKFHDHIVKRNELSSEEIEITCNEDSDVKFLSLE
jgi:hypothetical protein